MSRGRTVSGRVWRAVRFLSSALTRAISIGLGALGTAMGRPPETLLPPDPLPPPRRQDYRP